MPVGSTPPAWAVSRKALAAVREWERYPPGMSDIDERVLDALALDWPKLSVSPNGETEEISLASVRELAQYLSVTESTIRRFEAAPEAPRPH
jgi:hypothetical protein